LPRFKEPEGAKEMLTDEELKAIRDSFDQPTFQHVRDRAIFEVHMATAFRYDTVLKIPLASIDRLSGRVTVTTKGRDGGHIMQGRIDPKALAHVRTYIRMRPETTCLALFVQDDGSELTYQGARNIWRRIQKRSGVKRLGSHLIRHTYAQRMALAGAPIADIADVLGHSSDKMARHYAGAATKYAAADKMAQYSLSA
jgi:integrase/recombinase XerD